MVAKKSAKPIVPPKAGTKSATKPETTKQVSVQKQDKSINSIEINGWLQDATLEIPVAPGQKFAPGERELEFSIGMRQQEDDGQTKTELRGRALVHAKGTVLALAEASYVSLAASGNQPENLPQLLYKPLREHLERLLALGGHTPPLPLSLDKVE